MSYKTILVQLDFDGASAPRVKLAADLADRFEAELIGFAACDIQPPIATDGVIVDGVIMDEERAEIEQRLAQLEGDFRNSAGAGRSAEWRGYVSSPTSTLAETARAADLIVSGSLSGESGGDYYRSIDLGDLVLSAGRPVIVAADSAERVAADKIVVAWNDSREARRAVRDALPFLVRAKDVLVATVDDPESGDVRDGIEDVVRFLARHGVTGRSEVMGSAGGHYGERLVELARGMGADLIVSGAYGHSRVREWAFGGVTRSLLGSGSINRLMSN